MLAAAAGTVLFLFIVAGYVAARLGIHIPWLLYLGASVAATIAYALWSAARDRKGRL